MGLDTPEELAIMGIEFLALSVEGDGGGEVGPEALKALVDLHHATWRGQRTVAKEEVAKARAADPAPAPVAQPAPPASHGLPYD